MRSLDDVIRERQAVAAGPTPLPATATMSTPSNPYPRPVSPSDIWQQAFQPMTIAAHQQFGLQQTQQWNASNPTPMMGPAAINMMNMSNLAPLRAPFGTPPPALMTTPGMTGMFSTPGDIASQQGLMSSAAFLDPRTAAANLSSQRSERWGQKYGGWAGAAIGMAAGVGLIGGATIGGAVGGWIGENIGNAPIIKQMREFMNSDIANNLSWMAQAQHGTFGRVSMGGQDIGFGGRGLNTESAMHLGQKLKGMAGQSGGMFNQMDMMNLTQASGDAGLLDAATNIDQIANTVGSLMKVVGRLGKLTGDPDFRNNIRELGNLKQMGFTVDQAVDAIADVNRYARGAGMTRGQMSAGMEAGAARATGAGIASGVGAMSYAIGAQQSRMLGGVFDPVQANLMGGRGGIAQTIEEGRTAFVAQTSKLFIPSLLTVGPNGEISLDQDKMKQLGGVGSINMQAIAAHGQQNLHAVAQQVAQQTGQPIASVLGDLMGRMPEFQSKMALEMKGKIENIQSNMILGMRDTYGEYGAARVVMGSEAGARAKLATLRDPIFHERRVAQLQENIEEAEGAGRQMTRAMAQQRRDRANEWWTTKMFRGIGAGVAGVGDALWGEDAGDVIEAQTKAQEIADEEYTQRTGLSRMPRQRGGIGVNQKVVEEMKRHAEKQGLDLSRGEGMSAFTRARMGDLNVIGGEGALTENERIAWQRAAGKYGTVSGWISREIAAPLGIGVGSDVGTAKLVRNFMGQVKEMQKPIQRAMKRSRKDFTRMEISFMKEFDKQGIEGAGLLTTLKSEIKTKVAAMGEDGLRSLTKPQLKSMMTKALRDKGVPERLITKYVDENEEAATQLGLSVIVHEGSEAAQDVLKENLDVVDLFEKYSVSGGSMKDLEEEMRTKALSQLEEYGIIDYEMDWEGTGVTQSGAWKKKFEDVEEEYAHGLMTGAREEGVQAVGKKGALTRTLLALVGAARQGVEGAKEELDKFKKTASDDDLAALDRAQAIYASPGKGTKEEKKARQKELGRYWAGKGGKGGGIRKMVAAQLGKKESEVTVQDVSSVFESAEKGGGGDVGKLFFKETYTSFADKQGPTAAAAGEHGIAAPAGSPDAKSAAMLREQLALVQQMRSAWIGPGSIGEDMKETTKYLQNTTVYLADAIAEIKKP